MVVLVAAVGIHLPQLAAARDGGTQLNEKLRDAMARFDSEAVRALVRSGADPASRIPNDLSPFSRRSNYPTVLMLGVLPGDEKFITEVLATGADIDASDGDGWTPLMIASALGEPKMVRLLLAKGAETRLIAKSGVTALGLAIGAGRVDVAAMLPKAGAKDPTANVHYIVRRLGAPGIASIPGEKVTVEFGKDTCVKVSDDTGLASCCIGHRTCANSFGVGDVRIHLRGGLFLIEYHDSPHR